MRLLRALRIVVTLWLGAKPRRAVLVGIGIPCRQLAGFIGAATISLLADAALQRQVRLAVLAALLGAAWVLAQGALAVFTDRRRSQLHEEIFNQAWLETSTRVASAPGLRHLEEPAILDRLKLLLNDCGHVAAGFWFVAMLLGFVLQLAAIVSVLARIDLILLLLPLFALPSLVGVGIAQSLRARADTETAEQARLRDRLAELARTPAGGREARLFGIGEELASRVRMLAAAVSGRLDRAERLGALIQTGGWLILAAGYLGALVLVTERALTSRATPGQLLFTLIAAQQIQGLVASAVGIVQSLQGVLRSALRIEWLYAYADRARPVIRAPVEIPGRLSRGIELQSVSFCYPGTERTVLDGVSALLPAGSVVALVGENGAGKTTLVKLLCRFYEPTSGRILVDGEQLASMPIEAWRRRITAAFQDYARFELRCRESVGIGDLRRLEDVPFIEGALARAGAGDVATALPLGLESQLGAQWRGGVDLSGGQWQRVALARGLMRDIPLLQVFDEPTSNLDPRAEHELFTRLARAARSDRGQRQVTILVSHRFSTVRMADLIVVLDSGRIREQGTHEELIARGELYAELYGLQAASYG